MRSRHRVRQGECISSISDNYGFFWKTVWDYPKNKNLKEKRKIPNALMPNDILIIPDRSTKEEPCNTEEFHRFKKKSGGTKLVIQLMAGIENLANNSYRLNIDGHWESGQTDADGYINHEIPAGARDGKLLLGEGHEQVQFDLSLGEVDPVDEITGVQARLMNLGLYEGDIDGVLNDDTREAIAAFRAVHHLDESTEIDKEFQERLTDGHGS